MKSVCTECGKVIGSRFVVFNWLKVLVHLRLNHESLWEEFSRNPEEATTTVRLDGGGIVDFLGDVQEDYTDDSGRRHVTIGNSVEITMSFRAEAE